MFKLLKNEFFKLIHKKSTFIFIGIIFLYVILVNVIYSYNQTEYFYNEKNDVYISELKEKRNNLNKNNEFYYSDYVDLSVQIDMQEQIDKFKENWKKNIIYSNYQQLAEIYYDSIYINPDKELELKYKEEMNKFIEFLENDNWQYFVEQKITNLNENINTLKKDRLTASENNIIEIDLNIKINEYILDLNKYRINNNVSYEKGYLNTAVEQLEMGINSYYRTNVNDLKKEEKDYYYSQKSEILKNEYILENKMDINSDKNLRSMFQYFFQEYLFFIILFVIMVTGGILSEEFNKGTIKSLLITPYSRTKILLSKFITSLLSLPIITFITFIFVFIIGGITFGFSSLNIPVVEYSYTLDKLVEMTPFSNFLLMFAANAPMIILLITLAFTLSVILPNTAFAISLSFAGFIAANIINSLAFAYNVKFLRYFVTLNWDFTQYLFGKTPHYSYINLPFSIIVCIVYFIIMLVFSIILFKHKNVKNV